MEQLVEETVNESGCLRYELYQSREDSRVLVFVEACASEKFLLDVTSHAQAILFAVLFIVVGLVVFSFVAPLLFRGGNMQQIGAAAFPIIFLVCGIAGLVFGWRRRTKS